VWNKQPGKVELGWFLEVAHKWRFNKVGLWIVWIKSGSGVLFAG
jgi:hypothetical protein